MLSSSSSLLVSIFLLAAQYKHEIRKQGKIIRFRRMEIFYSL